MPREILMPRAELDAGFAACLYIPHSDIYESFDEDAALNDPDYPYSSEDDFYSTHDFSFDWDCFRDNLFYELPEDVRLERIEKEFRGRILLKVLGKTEDHHVVLANDENMAVLMAFAVSEEGRDSLADFAARIFVPVQESMPAAQLAYLGPPVDGLTSYIPALDYGTGACALVPA